MRILKSFLNMIFPDRCVGCGIRGFLLCRECETKITPATNPMHSWITSVFAYGDFRVRRLVRLLKYKNARGVATVLARSLSETLLEFLGEEGLFLGSRNVLIVPIPLSQKRMAKRGYNQSELLARKTVDQIKNDLLVLEIGLLKKIKETTPQAEIKHRGKRLENLGDCFVATQTSAGGEVVILIDDVTTTGATLMAARKALRRAGFRKVYGFTVAH